jgi:polygalacturonase
MSARQEPARSRRAALKAGGALAGGVLATSLLSARPAAANPDDPWRQVPRILQRVTPPEFPKRTFRITDFGAVGDGKTDCTAAFRRAIAACHRAGGGQVVVPSGRFATGPIHLRSRVNLHVVDGATIAFNPDPAAYLPVVLTRWEGTECYNYSPFIYAYGRTDVAVTGGGVLDGQARLGPWESWYANSGPQRVDQQELRRMGNEGVPVAQRQFGAGHYLRPSMVEFYRCRNVLVDGVTLLDPPMWTVHPVLSNNVTVRGITVHSVLYNTDGCDPEASSNVHITGCRFDTNDDCIAIKAGRDEDGHRVGVPSENIVIDNCLFSGRWGGVTVGSEMSGGVRNVFAQRCTINPPEFPGRYPVKYPLYIKTNKRRGGVIDGVYLRDFTGGGVERDAIFVTMDYNSEPGEHPVVVRNIDVRNMRINGARAALNLVGLPTDHLVNVRLRDCEFTGVVSPNTVQHVDGLTLTRVTVNGQPL